MLVDEVREAKENGEVMKEKTGTCKFCKKLLFVKIPELWTQASADGVASESCSCIGSIKHVRQMKKMAALHEALETLFGEESERDVNADTVENIRKIALDIIACNLEKATIDIPSSKKDAPSERLKISLKKDGLYIGIEKKASTGILI